MTNRLVYGVLVLAISSSFYADNWIAAVAWAVAMTFYYLLANHTARVAQMLKSAQLFVEAHEGKWPSKKAEEHAVQELARFMQGRK